MDPEDVSTPERTEQMRCSMAMLTPGQLALRWALGRSCCHHDEDY